MQLLGMLWKSSKAGRSLIKIPILAHRPIGLMQERRLMGIAEAVHLAPPPPTPKQMATAAEPVGRSAQGATVVSLSHLCENHRIPP